MLVTDSSECMRQTFGEPAVGEHVGIIKDVYMEHKDDGDGVVSEAPRTIPFHVITPMLGLGAFQTYTSTCA